MKENRTLSARTAALLTAFLFAYAAALSAQEAPPPAATDTTPPPASLQESSPLPADSAALQSLPAGTPRPIMESLGEGRYRIGEILINKTAGVFSVPGRIIHIDVPLEYLAVSMGGAKEYESLLELNTSARDFNLACILIGLSDEQSVKPRYQFDERKAEGQGVAISITWQEDAKTVSVSGANAMRAGDMTFENDDWVYIGSSTSENDQQFAAEFGGTLIGIVHDPFSVIDHRDGAGIGAYGSVTGNMVLLPPEGSPITLVLSRKPE